jgi:hypothetical protein
VYGWEFLSGRQGRLAQLRTRSVSEKVQRQQGQSVLSITPACAILPVQGYLPRDLYCLDSKYGSEADLRNLISVFHEHGIKVCADVVVNHRCATYQVSYSILIRAVGVSCDKGDVAVQNVSRLWASGEVPIHKRLRAGTNLSGAVQRVPEGRKGG